MARRDVEVRANSHKIARTNPFVRDLRIRHGQPRNPDQQCALTVAQTELADQEPRSGGVHESSGTRQMKYRLYLTRLAGARCVLAACGHWASKNPPPLDRVLNRVALPSISDVAIRASIQASTTARADHAYRGPLGPAKTGREVLSSLSQGRCCVGECLQCKRRQHRARVVHWATESG
jgi:hypothetical protein